MTKRILQSRNEWYEELMAKSDIISIISDYITLNRKGTTHWGCCPFHHEKTPSFSVSEQKQVYHCFGCGESGNVITFIKKIESVEYGDAIKILAKKAGMIVPEYEFHKKDNEQTQKKKQRLYALMRESARFYNQNLKSDSASVAREYLQKRGLNDNLVTRFGLGYSTNGSDIINHLEKCGYTSTEMKEAGITAVSEKGAYDVFYSRLMFPIISNMDEVVGFGGRTLKANPDFAKYRNSSQSLIFDKSKIIYGVNLLKKKKQREKFDYIILCEGYMDVIALHSAGFDTAVASMGTALTLNQAKQLRNFVEKVYISYDGDTAGQKASLKGLDILSSVGLNVRVVELPDGMDPDDIIKKKGNDFYQQLLDNAITLTAFKIKALQSQYDISDIDGKAKFAVEAVKVVKALKNPIEHEEYFKIIQNITGYSYDALLRQAEIKETIKPLIKRNNSDADKNTKSNIDKATSAEKFVLTSIVNEKDYVDFTENFSDLLTDSFSKEIAEFFVKKNVEEVESLSGIYDIIDDSRYQEFDELLHHEFIDGDDKVKYDKCVAKLKLSKLLEEQKEITAKFDASVGEERMAILPRMSEIGEIIKGLKNKGDADD